MFGVVCVVGGVASTNPADLCDYRAFLHNWFHRSNGASGILCRLEMISPVLLAMISKTRCMSGYSILL